ncbi:NADPH:quinone oxidoreductase family protein [Bradyrhizobium sp. 23AC]
MPRALICRALGDPSALDLAEVASAPLHRRQVRVRVRAAGLNYPDILVVAGRYQHKPALPFVPGLEAAGDVIEVSKDVKGLSVGDKVIVKSKFGTFAEEIVADLEAVRPLPVRFDYAQGATFLTAYGTALYGLAERARLRVGETLLVHGAAGGVGLAAVELGKAYGAQVIAVASTPEKLVVAKDRGADRILLSGLPFREQVKEFTSGRGADVVFDPVGGSVFEESIRCINFGARILVVGFVGGIGMAKTNLILMKNATLHGIRAGEALRRAPRHAGFRWRALARLAESGAISPHVSHRIPFERWQEAMELLTDRRAVGRVALIMK